MPSIPLIKPEIQKVVLPEFFNFGVDLKILRLDKMHKDLGGNKWFKLKFSIKEISSMQDCVVLSFGGPYSNHLRALSAAGKYFSFKTIGIVRGEIVRPLNPVLEFAETNGMRLYGVSRHDYRLKNSEDFIAGLRDRFGSFVLLPEGGSNQNALLGCKEICGFIDPKPMASFRYIALACGTGVTLSGIALGANSFQNTKILGVSVLNAPGYLSSQVQTFIQNHKQSVLNSDFAPWGMLESYHFGGYAKTTPDLLKFSEGFTDSTGVPLEPVYTGKLFYALAKEVERGSISPGDEILAIHTGGIY